jgi:hypothetical protein
MGRMSFSPLTIEKLLALATALACGVMLLRMVLKPTQRQRLDMAAQRAWWKLSAGAQHLWRWRQRRQAHDQARRTAQAVIDRARQGQTPVKRDGNVLTPESFQRPRKPH